MASNLFVFCLVVPYETPAAYDLVWITLMPLGPDLESFRASAQRSAASRANDATKLPDVAAWNAASLSLSGIGVRIRDSLLQRFGTKAVRFRYAVSLGFIIAMVGFIAAGPDSQSLFAEESFLSALFGHALEQPVQPAAFRQVAEPRLQRRHGHHHRPDAIHLNAVRLNAVHPNAVRPNAIHLAIARGTGLPARQSLCVRLCDGYVYPIGVYSGEGDRVAHEAICQSSCPDAATSLYILPAGSDKIDSAVKVGTDRQYSALPDAFHYTTVLDDACTCHKGRTEGRTMSLLRDFTLRRGDAVMTKSGVKVFHGGARYPYHRTDFVALSRSRDVRKTDRATFGAIERASLRGGGGAGHNRTEPQLSQTAQPKPVASNMAPPRVIRLAQDASQKDGTVHQ